MALGYKGKTYMKGINKLKRHNKRAKSEKWSTRAGLKIAGEKRGERYTNKNL